MKHCQLRAYAQHVLEFNSWSALIAMHFGALSNDLVTALCANAADISQRFPGLVAKA